MISKPEPMVELQISKSRLRPKSSHRKKNSSNRTAAALLNSASLYYFYFLVQALTNRLVGDETSIFSEVFLIILVPVCILVGSVWARSPQSLGRLLIARSAALQVGVPFEGVSWNRRISAALSVCLIALTFWLGWLITEVNFEALLSSEGMAGARRIFYSLFHPEFRIFKYVLRAMVETIFMAFMATAFAIPFAFVASFFCARNLMKGHFYSKLIYNLLRLVFNFTRSVEPLIWAIIFSVWVGIGPFAGMLALMLHSISSLAKLYSEQIEGIERGPIEAIEATGANRIQVIWFAVVPQIILPYLSFTIYRWDINIRMATIIGLVGGGGIGTLLMQYQGLAKWHEVGMIVLVIASVVWLMDYVSAKLREAIY